MKVVLNMNATDLLSGEKQTICVDKHDNDEHYAIETKMKWVKTNIVFELS